MRARDGRRSLASAALAASLWAVAPAAASAGDESIAAAAFRAGERGDWFEARRIASQAGDPVVPGLVIWMDATRQPQGGGTFSEVAGFVIDHPDWPLLKLVRQRAEKALDDSVSDAAVLSWFGRFEPLTLPGAKRYVNALRASGQDARAAEVARAAWVGADAQTVDEEDDYFITFRDVLTSDDSARRLDRLLWAGHIPAAQRLLSRVDYTSRAVDEARIALRQGSDDASQLLAAVPAGSQGDPGLVYDTARWARKRGSDALARQTLTSYPVDYAQPDQFLQERSQVARRALADGNPEDAYRVAAGHGFTAGNEYADSEWLAGWIALRFLQQPDTAARHFLTMFENVRHPVTRARGAYWSARAASVMNETEAATLWHKTAAQHGIAFYGQLSAAEVRPGEPLRLPADPQPSPAEKQHFAGHELSRAIRLLAATGETDPQRAFVARLAELDESPAWKDMTASLAAEVGRTDLAVVVARQSVRAGTPLVRNGYPILPSVTASAASDDSVETPLVFAVIRQESAFDMRAVSSAGAQGLMQLMPGTARSVAGRLGLPYSSSDLTADPQYNVSLGRAYLSDMVSRFGGSYVMALAAYNAGPGRVNEWMRNGDPRAGTEAAVDWIELIPFSETRNYVQRCMENLQVYRALLGRVQLAQTLSGNPR